MKGPMSSLYLEQMIKALRQKKRRPQVTLLHSHKQCTPDSAHGIHFPPSTQSTKIEGRMDAELQQVLFRTFLPLYTGSMSSEESWDEVSAQTHNLTATTPDLAF